jgi:flagellar export protein FliJ
VNRRFRLGAVERLRTGALAEAARRLGQARRDLAEALSYQKQLHQELATCTPPARGTVPEAESAAARRARLRRDIGRAGERVSAAQGQELAALAGWHAARADLRAVEALHERHRLTLAEADARIEQRELDELAAQTRRPDPGGDPS